MTNDPLRASNKLLLWGAILNSIAVPPPILWTQRDLNIDGVTGWVIALIFWCFVMGPIALGFVLSLLLRRLHAPEIARKWMFVCACFVALAPLGLALLELLSLALEPNATLPWLSSLMYVSYVSVFLLVSTFVIWLFASR